MRRKSMNEIKIPKQKEIEEFIVQNDLDASGVLSGIQFLVDYQKESVFKKTNHLDFEIDTQRIFDLITDENSEGFDELYSIYTGIEFTDVTEKNHGNGYKKEIVISFLINEHAIYEGNKITIDDKGRVFAEIGESPWEGGGIEGEIEEIVMEYVTKQKYLKNE